MVLIVFFLLKYLFQKFEMKRNVLYLIILNYPLASNTQGRWFIASPMKPRGPCLMNGLQETVFVQFLCRSVSSLDNLLVEFSTKCEVVVPSRWIGSTDP